jgi:hypothetical protein
MKLHEAIEKLLSDQKRPMSTTEIADHLNRTQWYQKKDKSQITDFQIHGRTKNYPQLFSRNGTIVSLRKLNDRPIEVTPVRSSPSILVIIIVVIVIAIIYSNVS